MDAHPSGGLNLGYLPLDTQTVFWLTMPKWGHLELSTKKRRWPIYTTYQNRQHVSYPAQKKQELLAFPRFCRDVIMVMISLNWIDRNIDRTPLSMGTWACATTVKQTQNAATFTVGKKTCNPKKNNNPFAKCWPLQKMMQTSKFEFGFAPSNRLKPI